MVICDEYQAFASVGEDDPSGDEKAFALTRQCRVIPIVATQSISSLRSVLGSGEAWRTLLQTLRTRIFLSLSDEASAEIASKLCGQVAKIKSSYTINESAKSSGINLLSAQAGGGRGREQEFSGAARGALSAARLRLAGELSGDLSPLRRRAIAPAAPGVLEAALPPGRPPVLDRQADRAAMSSGDGLDLLKPFLPGLEAALEDPDVSEIMINGPGNVWLEGHGRLRPIDAPALDAAALERAAIHIARPLGLDPATTPVLDARLGDGSRVAICVPPASPHVAITVRRFGTRSFSAAQLVEQGALPEYIRHAAERILHTRRNILVSGGTGSGKTTLLNALIALIPDDERIVAIEDTLELRIDAPNCVRFEARGLQHRAVTIRDLVRHALRHRPDHIVVGEVRGGGGRRPVASPQHRPWRIAHHRPRQQRRERPVAPGELRHARRRRSPVGRHVPRRRRRHRDGDPHDSRRRPALRGRSRVRPWLRGREKRMGDRTTRPQATLAACRIRRLVVVAPAVLAWLPARQSSRRPVGGSAQVDRVIDGDTIGVRRDGARFTVVTVHSSKPRRVPRAMGRPGKELMMTKEIADAGTLSTKAGKALDRMRARAVKADGARAAQVVAAATEAANRAAADAWDAVATQAAAHADQYRHRAELADRTRHRWAR